MNTMIYKKCKLISILIGLILCLNYFLVHNVQAMDKSLVGSLSLKKVLTGYDKPRDNGFFRYEDWYWKCDNCSAWILFDTLHQRYINEKLYPGESVKGLKLDQDSLWKALVPTVYTCSSCSKKYPLTMEADLTDFANNEKISIKNVPSDSNTTRFRIAEAESAIDSSNFELLKILQTDTKISKQSSVSFTAIVKDILINSTTKETIRLGLNQAGFANEKATVLDDQLIVADTTIAAHMLCEVLGYLFCYDRNSPVVPTFLQHYELVMKSNKWSYRTARLLSAYPTELLRQPIEYLIKRCMPQAIIHSIHHTVNPFVVQEATAIAREGLRELISAVLIKTMDKLLKR